MPTLRRQFVFPPTLVGFFSAGLVLLLVPVLSLGAEPQWIWNDPGAGTKTAKGRAFFRVAFEAPAVESARVEIACDNTYALFVNNERSGAGIDWQQLDVYDVTPLLREGRNCLAVLAENGDDGPGGLVVRLSWKDKAGKSHELLSGKGWRTNPREVPGWREPAFDDTAWAHASELGPLGTAAPWGQLKRADKGTVRPEFTRKPRPEGPFQLLDGDRVVFVGDTLVERASRDDYWEASLTARFPDRQITFRNLGWSADTPGGDARAGFGTVEDGYQQLKAQIYAAQPTVVFVCYGAGSAFDGESGLPKFEAGLQRLLDDLAVTKAEVVLVSPLRHEQLPKPLPDPAAHNRELDRYTRAIQKLAEQRGLKFVNLFEGLISTSQVRPEQSLTDNGLHLRPRGYLKLGRFFADRLGWTPPRPMAALSADGRLARQTGAQVTNLKRGDGGSLSFDLTLDRLSLPSGDAGTACRLQVQGLPAGTWNLVADGKTWAKATAERWGEGVDLVESPDLAQFEALRQEIVEKNQLYFHRWRPQNETYLFGFRKHEQGNNAREIPMFDPLVEKREEVIAELRVPRLVKYRLVRE